MSEPDDFDRGAIAEAFNLGMGMAAANLSEMTGSDISLSVTDLQVLKKSAAVERIEAEAEPDITGVEQTLCGTFHGSAMLLFPTRSSLNLVRLLLKDAAPQLEYLTELEEEALLETGNIILNACLGAIAREARVEIVNELPHAVHGQPGELLLDDQPLDDRVIQLKMDLGVDGVNIRGCLALLLDITSLDHFRDRVTRHFGSAA
jgi:chemotaxis protein CheC